jgi:hypothetical protein
MRPLQDVATYTGANKVPSLRYFVTATQNGQRQMRRIKMRKEIMLEPWKVD